MEEFDGQPIAVYDSDNFIRKSIPVLEAMASQKTGKKLFLGVVSNALVGVTNSMSFFWWTPTRLMSKKDLNMMSAHVDKLKARLQAETTPSVADVVDETVHTNVSNELEVAVIDDFTSSDGETDDLMAQLVQNDLDQSQMLGICLTDDNGNTESLPTPKPMTSTPKVSSPPMSQKKVLQELRKSWTEKGRMERQGSYADVKKNLNSMLEEKDDEDEIQNRLQLQMSFKNQPGGINYNLLIFM